MQSGWICTAPDNSTIIQMWQDNSIIKKKQSLGRKIILDSAHYSYITTDLFGYIIDCDSHLRFSSTITPKYFTVKHLLVLDLFM